MAQVCHRLSVACSTATGDEYVRALTLTRLSGDVTHGLHQTLGDRDRASRPLRDPRRDPAFER
jgi:hypothetical protein